jgi:hypothetical protein
MIYQSGARSRRKGRRTLSQFLGQVKQPKKRVFHPFDNSRVPLQSSGLNDFIIPKKERIRVEAKYFERGKG